MTVILIIGLFLLAYAAVMLARGAGLARSGSSTVRAIGGYGFNPVADADAPARTGLLARLADRLGVLLSRRGDTTGMLRKRLIAAGMYTTPTSRFLGYQILLGVGLPVGWLVFAGVVGAGGIAMILGLVSAIMFGVVGPGYYLTRKGRARQAIIDRELPELIDLLVVTVEAGVGFAGALRIAAERLSGPIGEELRLTLQEQAMGLTTTEAIRNFGERCPTPGVRVFVRSLMQGETLGVSIGQIMRNVALEMRKRRRALAEERAQKAPVKMLFPLIFLIFPALFIVLLVPAIISFLRAVNG
jgi:tight adherence protein C